MTMTPLQRLESGYYNSDPVTSENPGGLAGGGHQANFPAALADLAAAILATDPKTVLNGAGPPSDALGKNGDFYIDNAGGRIYGPKAGGEWPEESVRIGGEDGREVTLQVTATHIQWRLGDDAWADLLALADLKGDPGDDGADAEEISLQTSATHIQWRRGEGAWSDLVLLSDLKGDPGDDGADAETVSLQVTATHIQWRLGDDAWTDLVALADLKGDPGDDGADAENISLQVTATHIQWRLGDGAWADLVALADLKGETGGLPAWALKTAAYTAVAGDRILADTSAGAWTLTLPATPADGDEVTVRDVALAWGDDNLTIGRNGETIVGAAEDLVCDQSAGFALTLTLVFNGGDWSVG